jgi:hypothetical protein
VPTFQNHYRWKGEAVADVWQPPSTNRGVGKIAVTVEETVWAGGTNRTAFLAYSIMGYVIKKAKDGNGSLLV